MRMQGDEVNPGSKKSLVYIFAPRICVGYKPIPPICGSDILVLEGFND
jgi:hypothetical protein